MPIAGKANPPWSIGAQSIVLLSCHKYLPAGDYTLLGGNVIVDREDNILELYKDFAGSQNRGSYKDAALLAQSAGKQLVYVVGTDTRRSCGPDL